MATLKDHQQAMVDLLASGSGIPTSASRLAHAMHDVLSAMLGNRKESFAEEMTRLCNERIEATTPGLNDKALAADVEACRPKQEIKESLLRAKERRVKELENTVRQLRARVMRSYGKITNGWSIVYPHATTHLSSRVAVSRIRRLIASKGDTTMFTMRQ
ncbi:hypothetical protein PF627_gp56 [Salmonella virus VSiP]|uniref:Uncharacterized protein n=1 Tax=Salmonella virus VSiP TaxID=2301721 RepID=A0A385EEF7_9CAUD|nr:hypothetical protein PF627_gp56 [Salmonella virus VSiP]AXQ70241.1 hypothetical protein vsip_56 [Salmonella virus VSiP]